MTTRLHVLLVHDDVVGGEAVRQGVGGALGVVEGDLDAGAAHGLGPDEGSEGVGLVADVLHPGVPRSGDGRELVDLGLQLADLFGLGGHVAVLVDDESGQVTARGAQLGALGRGVARREEDTGQPGDDGDDERPGGRSGAALGHTLPLSTGVTCGGVQLR